MLSVMFCKAIMETNNHNFYIDLKCIKTQSFFKTFKVYNIYPIVVTLVRVQGKTEKGTVTGTNCST